ncbi:UMP-CMP kinase isoform 2-T2 [Callospermophilus lateralis]|uniref:UMP-CMP kinase isoform X2 n=1 Tax=Callospermophilus lateralis TaxID=76772 RepID=UPI00403859A7
MKVEGGGRTPRSGSVIGPPGSVVSYTPTRTGSLNRRGPGKLRHSQSASDPNRESPSHVREWLPTRFCYEMDQTMAANAEKNKFLIDGFPRNQDNLQGWNKTMDGKADVSFVLFFDCDNEICIERCLERGKSSGRSDDNRESLEKRIQTYLQSTKPIIDLYEEMGKVKKIDASKSVDEVFDEVVKIFDKEG